MLGSKEPKAIFRRESLKPSKNFTPWATPSRSKASRSGASAIGLARSAARPVGPLGACLSTGAPDFGSGGAGLRKVESAIVGSARTAAKLRRARGLIGKGQGHRGACAHLASNAQFPSMCLRDEIAKRKAQSEATAVVLRIVVSFKFPEDGANYRLWNTFTRIRHLQQRVSVI